MHQPFQPYCGPQFLKSGAFDDTPNPNQLRWLPFHLPKDGHSIDWLDGLHTICGAGDTKTRFGSAVHVYMCNISMKDKLVLQCYTRLCVKLNGNVF